MPRRERKRRPSEIRRIIKADIYRKMAESARREAEAAAAATSETQEEPALEERKDSES